MLFSNPYCLECRHYSEYMLLAKEDYKVGFFKDGSNMVNALVITPSDHIKIRNFSRDHYNHFSDH